MPHQPDSGHDYAQGRQIATTTSREAEASATTLGAALLAQPDLAASTRRVHTQRRTRSLLIGADYRMRERVAHPDGGQCPVEQILHDEEEQRHQIELEITNGSRKHHRLPVWLGQVPKLVTVLDFCLMLYFFTGLSKGKWLDPLLVRLAWIIVVSVVVTVLTYGFLAFAGQRMRAYKNHAGTVYLAELDGFTKAALLMALVLVIMLAIVTFAWARIEVSYALGSRSGFTGIAIAVAITVVNVAANCLVIGVHAVNGSDQVARLSKLSGAIRRSTAQAHRMRASAARVSRPHCKATDE